MNINSMTYINELAYSNHIAQTKQLAKDKKQKNKYRQTVLLDNNQASDEISEALLDTLNTTKEEDERRDGSDRRIDQQDRGRYVESRLKKNRRYKRELSLKI